MEMKNQQQYSLNGKEKVVNHLASQSGYYVDKHGNKKTLNDLTTLDQYYDMVLGVKGVDDKGNTIDIVPKTLASWTDLKYTKMAKDATGAENSPKPAPDKKNMWDHIVLEGVPTLADAKKYEEIIREQLEHTDLMFVQKGQPQILLGEREILVRSETNAKGNTHIHFLVSRASIITKEQLEEKKELLENSPNSEEVKKLREAIDKALNQMKLQGCDKALSQLCNFNAPYVQNILTQNINNALKENGLSPIPDWGSHTLGATGNNKTSAQTKTEINEVIASGYSEEAIEKAIEKATTEEYSSLDSVILEKRKNENNDRLKQLQEEIRRVTSENKKLDEAQSAINKNIVLVRENERLQQENDTVKNEAIQAKQLAEESTQKLNLAVRKISKRRQFIKEIIIAKKQADNDYSNMEEVFNLSEAERVKLDKANQGLIANVNNLQNNIAIKDADIQRLSDDVVKKDEKIANLTNDLSTETQRADNAETRAKIAESTQLVLGKTIERLEEDKIKANLEMVDLKAKHQEEIALLRSELEAVKQASEASFAKVAQLDIVNEELTKQNEAMASSNQHLNAKVEVLTTENKKLMEIAVKLSEFTKKVSATLDKFTTAVKGFIKSAPTLKNEVNAIVKETATVSKEGKQMSEVQKMLADRIRAQEEASKASQAGADANAPGANQVKPK